MIVENLNFLTFLAANHSFINNLLKMQTDAVRDVIGHFREDADIFAEPDGRRSVCLAGQSPDRVFTNAKQYGLRHMGRLPGIYPEWLGDQNFAKQCNCRFTYVVGEMARGIAGSRMVVAAVDAGFTAFFGSAGLGNGAVRTALREIKQSVDNPDSWGANLIHSPDRPLREAQFVDVCLAEGIRNVSASAFMALSKEIVRYSAVGLSQSADGRVSRSTRVFAKISRPETAAAFMEPPPSEMLHQLVEEKAISAVQAQLQATLPTAEFITVESDSGGHTDGRPLTSLFPTIARLRDKIMQTHRYANQIFLGAAGGLGTPDAVAAAYALGADYVVTGSINQCTVEAGISDAAKAMLQEAGVADMAMAPAADMFEIGAKVQVLKRGTMFPVIAQRLYELYRRYTSIADLPAHERNWVEKKVLQQDFLKAWAETRQYHAPRNPQLIARADMDDHIKMALVFKRFLFQCSSWAFEGIPDRRANYQIWCGPAMGAFNDWVSGTFLEDRRARSVKQIGLNLVEGAARMSRIQQLRVFGVAVPEALQTITPQILKLE